MFGFGRLFSANKARATAGVTAVFASSTLWITRARSECLQEEKITYHIHKGPRVLVTGFHDWRELGSTPNIWRCRDNPSCRLLLGPPSETPPIVREGTLPQSLEQRCPNVRFVFQTLPVVWNASSALDYHAFDVVIHIGLGVYDCHNRLVVEHGAFNGRRGEDALGNEGGNTIEYGREALMFTDTQTRILEELKTSLLRSRVENFDVVVKPARQGNSYLCNETHWRALKATQLAENNPKSNLKAAFFLHIPTPSRDTFESESKRIDYEETHCDTSNTQTDYSELSEGVGDVIGRLVHLSV